MEGSKSKKDKNVPVHNMEAYKGNRSIAPLILIFGTSPFYFQERTPVQKSGWAPQAVWTFWRKEKFLDAFGNFTVSLQGFLKYRLRNLSELTE
jgi:hypothetical protein